MPHTGLFRQTGKLIATILECIASGPHVFFCSVPNGERLDWKAKKKTVRSAGMAVISRDTFDSMGLPNPMNSLEI